MIINHYDYYYIAVIIIIIIIIICVLVLILLYAATIINHQFVNFITGGSDDLTISPLPLHPPARTGVDEVFQCQDITIGLAGTDLVALE